LLGMGLLYWDQYGNDWAFTAAWPPIMGSVGGTYAAFLGDAELGREADRIFTDPQQLEFSAQQGGEATAALELSVGATTENEQDFMATVSEPWILVSRNEATTPATIEVRAEPGSLAPGAYVGALTIIAPGAKNSPLQVPVGFEVEELPPRFGVEPGQVDFKMTEGGQLPAAQNITVSNLGGGDLEWKATVSGDWFQLSALEGSAPAKPSVTVNDEQLPTGSYSGVILFSAPGIDPAPVKVSLNVEARQVDAEDPDETAGCSCTSAGRLPLPGASLLLLLVLLAGIRRR